MLHYLGWLDFYRTNRGLPFSDLQVRASSFSRNRFASGVSTHALALIGLVLAFFCFIKIVLGILDVGRPGARGVALVGV